MAKTGYDELRKKVSRLESELAECMNQKYALSMDKVLFETLFKKANDAIFIENNKEEIIDVNDRALELTGFTREQLLMMKTIDLQPPERHNFPMFTEGRHETIMQDADGKKIPIEITVSPLKLGKRQFFMSIVRDISKFRSAEDRLIKYRDKLEDLVEERAREIIQANKKLQQEIIERIEAEKALREQNDFNYAVFNNNPIQTIIVNREGKITNYNLAKRESGDRIPGIGEVMYKDFAGNHESNMYAELMDCINTGRVKSFKELKYREKYLSITIAPFSKGAIITSIDITEQKIAEQALNKSEEKYRTLFETSNDLIFTEDLYGKFTFTNKVFEKILGYTDEMLIGMGFKNLVHEKDLEKVEAQLERVRSGSAVNDLEIILKTVTGGEISVLGGISPVFDSKNNVVMISGIIRDITHRKRMDVIKDVLLRILEAKAKTRTLKDLLMNIHNEISKLMDAKNFYVALYNNEDDTYEFPYHVDEHYTIDTSKPVKIGKSFTEFVRKNNMPMLLDRDQAQEYLKSNKVKLIGVRSESWMGVPLNVNKETIGVVAVQSYTNPLAYSQNDLELMTLISEHLALVIERTRSEDALIESEIKYRDLVEKSNLAISIEDVDGRILFANENHSEVFGYSQEELKKLTVRDFILPEDHERIMKYHVARIKGKKAPSRYEARGIRKNGTIIDTEVDSVVLKQGDRIIGTRTYIRDITERKRSEKITTALNEISKASVAVTKVDELYPLIHRSLSKVIDTTNFFIALYDKEQDIIHFPYMVDEKDGNVKPMKASDSMSGTAHIINTGKAFFNTEDTYKKKLKKGELKKHGSSSKVWVGVPLKTKGEVIGAMVVQSYRDKNTFSEKDIPILEIVADRISTVIDGKRAEEALRRSEEKYRVLVESANDAIFVIDRNGLFQSANKTSAKILGTTVKDLLGNNIFDYLPEGIDKEQVKRYANVFKSGKYTRIDEFYIPFRADKKWFSIILTPIRDKTGTVAFMSSIARDITKLKKVQESLEKYQSELEYMVEQRTKDVEQKERELKALLDNITDEAWLKDSRSRYIIVNKAFSDYCKIPQDEMKGKNDYDVYPSKIAKEYRNEDRKILETGETLRFDYSFFDSKNKFRAFETIKNPIYGENNKIIGTVGISREISERKLAEEALREKEERFRALFENMSDGVVIYKSVENGKNFEILDENKAFRRMTRTQRKKIKGKYITDILPNIKKAGEFDQIYDVWYKGKASTIPSGRYKDDNIDIWTEKYIYRLPSDEIAVFYNDITEKIHAETALRESQQQLHQSQRLAATGRLAASIAHEINNPLQAIAFNIGFLEEALPSEFSEKESLKQIVNGTKRIKGTVKQLLDIHRKHVKTHEMVNINEIIESTLGLLENQLFINKIEVKRKLDKDLPLINAHSQDLFQVFTNLILNAQDAIEDKGKLIVETKVLKKKLKVIIEDDGIGIREKDMEHIFEPFYTTKSKMLGTGLGLSTTKGIVESFGGNIGVRSKEGKGSVFTLTFPTDQKKRK